MQAVSDHPDGYVRYRALVLLTGFNDPRARDVMREVLTSPNDRLRSVGYSFLEHNPDRSLLPNLLAAVDKESGEFVRPALVRALAAQAATPGDEGAQGPDGADARGRARPGLLPHRGDRGARRLQGEIRLRCPGRDCGARWPAAERHGDCAGQNRRSPRPDRARQPPAHGARGIAALRGRGHLSARRELRDT